MNLINIIGLNEKSSDYGKAVEVLKKYRTEDDLLKKENHQHIKVVLKSITFINDGNADLVDRMVKLLDPGEEKENEIVKISAQTHLILDKRLQLREKLTVPFKSFTSGPKLLGDVKKVIMKEAEGLKGKSSLIEVVDSSIKYANEIAQKEKIKPPILVRDEMIHDICREVIQNSHTFKEKIGLIETVLKESSPDQQSKVINIIKEEVQKPLNEEITKKGIDRIITLVSSLINFRNIAREIVTNELKEIGKTIETLYVGTYHQLMKGVEAESEDAIDDASKKLQPVQKILLAPALVSGFRESINQVKDTLAKEAGLLSVETMGKMMSSEKIDSSVQTVVTQLPLIIALLENPKPKLSDFKECIGLICDSLKDNIGEINSKKKSDLVLEAYLNQLSQLIESAGAKIQTIANETRFNFNDPKQKREYDGLVRVLNSVKKIFGLDIKLEVKMEVEYDILRTQLVEALSSSGQDIDLSLPIANSWIEENEGVLEEHLPAFQDWLGKKIAANYFEGKKVDCDGIFSEYVGQSK